MGCCCCSTCLRLLAMVIWVDEVEVDFFWFARSVVAERRVVDTEG